MWKLATAIAYVVRYEETLLLLPFGFRPSCLTNAKVSDCNVELRRRQVRGGYFFNDLMYGWDEEQRNQARLKVARACVVYPGIVPSSSTSFSIWWPVRCSGGRRNSLLTLQMSRYDPSIMLKEKAGRSSHAMEPRLLNRTMS